MIGTPGMRRRVLISAFLGLFTQMSGNTLLSYFQNIIYNMMGYTSTYAKTRINLANACWGLVTAVVAAIVVSKFRRRTMFLIAASSMLTVFTCMTISFERLSYAKKHKFTNKSAGIAALFFYFAYQPCYNIGNNALTYSTYLSFPNPSHTSTKPIQPTSSSSFPTHNEHEVSESNKSLGKLAGFSRKT